MLEIIIDLLAAFIYWFIPFVPLEQGKKITEPTVSLFPPSPYECKNPGRVEKKKTILCVGSGFYPDHVTVFWKINGKNVTKGVATNNPVQNNRSKDYTITSRLRVPAEIWNSSTTEFTCVVSFFNNETTLYPNATIYGIEGMFM